MTEAEDYIAKFTKQFARDNFGVDITVKFMNSIGMWGRCCVGHNLIKFSRPFIEVNKDNKDVLEALAIHECCHLKHPNHKSGFKQLCNSYGVSETHTRNRNDVVCPEPKKYYLYKCSNCGKEIKQMKYSNNESACRDCCKKYNNGRYDKKFKFRLVGWFDETKEGEK